MDLLTECLSHLRESLLDEAPSSSSSSSPSPLSAAAVLRMASTSADFLHLAGYRRDARAANRWGLIGHTLHSSVCFCCELRIGEGLVGWLGVGYQLSSIRER